MRGHVRANGVPVLHYLCNCDGDCPDTLGNDIKFSAISVMRKSVGWKNSIFPRHSFDIFLLTLEVSSYVSL